MNYLKIFLLSIFFICVIPVIYLYVDHGNKEINAYWKSVEKGIEYKMIKQSAEGILFYSIAIGYIITTLLIIIKPKWRTPYLVILVGTVALTILYYFRIYGIPIPFTDEIIRDLSTETTDVITKICQQILVIPIAMLLLLRDKKCQK